MQNLCLGFYSVLRALSSKLLEMGACRPQSAPEFRGQGSIVRPCEALLASDEQTPGPIRQLGRHCSPIVLRHVRGSPPVLDP